MPRHLHGRGDIVSERAFAADDFRRPAAKHIGWANEHGITDAIGYRYGFLPAASDTIFRLLELQLVDQCGKPLAILRQVDRIRRCAQNGNARVLQGLCELRSEEHTSELQSLMRLSYAVFCLKKQKT